MVPLRDGCNWRETPDWVVAWICGEANFWQNVLQNYFHDQTSSIGARTSTSAQRRSKNIVQLDSIIARSQRSKEFCNTIPPKAAVSRTSWMVSKVPCVDGSELARRIFTSQAWSVQPCVRPVCAVRMTAGHNALRGSGPGQNLAFDNALAQVGCPDRRIDRLCITCCSPSQPSHHAG